MAIPTIDDLIHRFNNPTFEDYKGTMTLPEIPFSARFLLGTNLCEEVRAIETKYQRENLADYRRIVQEVDQIRERLVAQLPTARNRVRCFALGSFLWCACCPSYFGSRIVDTVLGGCLALVWNRYGPLFVEDHLATPLKNKIVEFLNREIKWIDTTQPLIDQKIQQLTRNLTISADSTFERELKTKISQLQSLKKSFGGARGLVSIRARYLENNNYSFLLH